MSSQTPAEWGITSPPPMTIMNRKEFYFQRFTEAEVRANKCGSNSALAEWCLAIQRTYDQFLKKHKLPVITYQDRTERAKKNGHTFYPGSLLLTKAHVQLAEEILRDNNFHIQKDTQPMATNNQLYTTKDKEYVVRIGTNSSNEAVVEEKSTGRIFAVKPELLEKVLPYTVGVRFAENANVYHYLSEVDQVQQDDMLMTVRDGKLTLATVVGINTKSEVALAKLTDSFKGIIPFKKF